MKNILFLISMLFLFSCEDEEDFSEPFYLDENGVTIKAKDWVTAGTTGVLNGITYIAIDDSLKLSWDFTSQYPEITEMKQLVTTLVTNMEWDSKPFGPSGITSVSYTHLTLPTKA